MLLHSVPGQCSAIDCRSRTALFVQLAVQADIQIMGLQNDIIYVAASLLAIYLASVSHRQNLQSCADAAQKDARVVSARGVKLQSRMLLRTTYFICPATKVANQICLHEEQTTRTMSSPGVEPGLSRPQRDVLTTRR